MDAGAEAEEAGDVAPGEAVDLEHIRVAPHAGLPVGGGRREQEPGPDVDLDVGDGHRLGGGTGHDPDARVRSGSSPRRHSARDVRFLAQAGDGVRMPEQRQQRAADLAGGGVVSAHQEVRHHVEQLVVVEAVTLVLDLQQLADEVVRRIRSPALGQVLHVRQQTDDRVRRRLDLLGRHDAEGGAEGFGPARRASPRPRGARPAGSPSRPSGRAPVRSVRSPPPSATIRPNASAAERAASPRKASTARGVNAARHERAKARVGVPFVGEHQAAVPRAQWPLWHLHEVEQAEPHTREARVMGERFDIGVAQHDGGTAEDIRGRRSRLGRRPQQRVQRRRRWCPAARSVHRPSAAIWDRVPSGAPVACGAHDPAPHHQRAAVHQRREAPGEPGRVDAAGRHLRPLPAPPGRGGAVHLRHRRARHPRRAGRQGGRARRWRSTAGSSTRCRRTSASGSG